MQYFYFRRISKIIKKILNPITWNNRLKNKFPKNFSYRDIGCRNADDIYDLHDPNISFYLGADCDQREINRLNKTFNNSKFNWICAAISEKENEEVFYNLLESDPNCSYISKDKISNSLTKFKTKTIDKILEKFNLENIDIVKIDIEGNSSNALKGAKNLINSKKVRVYEIELLGNNKKEFNGVFNAFINSGYYLYSVKTLSEYKNKGTSHCCPVPILFDLIFVKEETCERDMEILNFLGYDNIELKTKTNLIDKFLSVFVDVLVHFLKRKYPRPFYRKVVFDGHTLDFKSKIE